MSASTPQQLLRRAEHNADIAQRDLNYYRGLLALQQRAAPNLDPDALPDVVSLQHRIRHAESVLEMAINYRDFLRRTVPQSTGVVSD